MTKFEIIFVPDTKFVHSFADRLTDFFKRRPDATLVSLDMKELRAMVMYEVPEGYDKIR